MPTIYLFRIDAAKDNDVFFALFQPSAFQVYAGVDINIGSSGWVPDLIKVVIDESAQALITLIELEATKREALISCRKYLPEDPESVVEKFHHYLDRVISRCRTAADPRKDEFVRLKEHLATGQIIITTAGALRSSVDFVEELPLIGQAYHTIQPSSPEVATQADGPTFFGTQRLSAHEAKGLRRTLMIIDAIIRKRDHSVLGSDRGGGIDKVQPLKYYLKKNPDGNPALRSFLSETGKSGITLDCDAILSELISIWLDTGCGQFDQERARNLITSYYPLAVEIKSASSMRTILDEARTYLASQIEG